jgi:LPS-assembly protein
MKKLLSTNKLIVVSAFIMAQAFSCLGVDYNADFDEWIVSPTCKDRTAQLCHGYYLEPEYPYPIDDETKYPTVITSNRGEFISKKTSKFFGNVKIQQGNQTLLADQATIIHNEETGDAEMMHAEGNVKVKQPDMRVDGTKATIYNKEDRKIIYNSTYRMYTRHARGTSDSITVEKQTQMFLPNGSYTTCAPKNNAWHLKAKKVKLNKDTGRGEAWHSWLYVKNFKVFYWPYINFPIDDRRQTGFLMPGLHGSHVSAPFYWNLAPNYDAIITPHFIMKRGVKVDNNFRYLTHHSKGNIKFNFLPNDKGYQKFRKKRFEDSNGILANDLRTTGLRDLHKRWAFSFDDKTTFNKNFKSEIDYSRIGDDNYIYDFDGDIMQQAYPIQSNNLSTPNVYLPNYAAATTAMRQKIELQNLTYLGTTTYRMEQYQILHPFDGPTASEVYRKLPELDFQSSIFDMPYDFDWKFSGNYTQFKMREVAFTEAASTGTRYHFQPILEHPVSELGWFIKPNAQLDVTSYRTMKLNTEDRRANKITSATRNVPIYNIDSGLIFERPLTITNNSFSQTLEPRAYYVYIPKREQSLFPTFDSAPITFDYNQVFRTNRYSGFDRVGEANQLGLGVMSRFLTDPTSEEKASVGIGRVLYFQDRIGHFPNMEPALNTSRWSPTAAIAKYQINPHWNVEGNLVKEKLNRTNAGSLSVQYITDPTHVINFGYQFTRNDTFLTDINRPSHLRTVQVSSAWEVQPQLRLLGSLAHDLNLSRVTNVLVGFENHNCCTIYRVAWMRTLKPLGNAMKQYDNAISLQFVLKGLSQAGNIDNGRINSMIPGYAPKDHEF